MTIPKKLEKIACHNLYNQEEPTKFRFMVAPVSLRPGLYSQLCCYKTELSSTVRWLEWELPALTTSENQAERESQTYV